MRAELAVCEGVDVEKKDATQKGGFGWHVSASFSLSLPLSFFYFSQYCFYLIQSFFPIPTDRSHCACLILFVVIFFFVVFLLE